MMNCTEAQELLSAYYDGELSPEVRAAVTAHVETCDDCSDELSTIGKLSAMAKSLTHPDPPAQLWNQFQRRLDAEPAAEPAKPSREPEQPRGRSRRRFLSPISIGALAALLLIAVGIGWFVRQTWFAAAEQHHLAADFDRYLQEFANDPHAAQQALAATHDGRAVNRATAAKELGYHPVAATSLPDGYSLSDMYVMDMPCCKCVQCICQTDDGRILSIFEHDEEQPAWFGERPTIAARCNGTPCRIVQVGDRLAASWKVGRRYVTVVGARDVEEVSQLVAHFQQQ